MDAREWHYARRAAALVAVMLTGLSATACGGGGRPTADATGPASLVAYSACMRGHGVPNFPDPDTKGNYPATDPQLLGVSSTQYEAAEQACQPLLPTGGTLQQQTNQCLWFGDCPPALLQQVMDIEREYSRCMRSHGVPNWPDPTLNKGRPAFDLTAAGIDRQSTSSSQFTEQDRACRSQLGGSVPMLPYT